MFKKLIFLSALLCISAVSYANTVKPFSGELSTASLIAEHPKFAQQYQAFSPNADELNVMQQLAGKELLVLFGIWCHDSQREVPRLLKLLDQSKVNIKSLKLIAVGYDKRDPQGIAAHYNLKYTPTIIVLDEGEELTRVVETPTHSLAHDLSQSSAVKK
ncbi:TlpA family protein disulfide reductase [Pseudoalteromonas prydzensis]|uniref:TlpA family protein disulfide reductase n=1 Tax=Pseudoalteromonas prydzensis TaxID=182141 RepID=UPI0024BCD9C7|nr:thioredoxin [Pseudoalteromonas prydzensis]